MPDNTPDMLTHALAYAERGWPVFPIHTPTADGCSCRKSNCDRVGKHPRISQGRNGATTDEATIRTWWGVWPNANIGIATGHESGLIVLDVDDGGDESLRGRELPDSVESITGSGGRHIIYLRPDSPDRFRTRVKFLDGLDSRADGGYIVAPPSLHASGNRYEWEGSSDPMEGVAVMPSPDWFSEAIRSDPLDTSLGSAPEWNPDGELPENIFDMLSTIPAEDYEAWRDVGMAIHYTDPADGLEVWDWWSSTAPNYSADAVRTEWRNFSRRGHQVANPLTISSVRRMAEEHGWIDPDIEHGAEIAGRLLESHQRSVADELRQAREKKTAPTDVENPKLVPEHGLIRDIVDLILRQSVRPQPELAVMAATAFVGALAGRKYQTETGLRTNLYLVGLAESGAGKDQARKTISKLANYADVMGYLGGDRIASGPGAITALYKNPSLLFMLDEFGLMLQAMTGQRSDPHKRELMAALMTLYSTAGGVYRGTEYADQKERPRTDIVHPNACIYGTSTHSQFYAALTSSQGVDGTLSRMIIAPSHDHRPPRQRPDLSPPSQSILDRVSALGEFYPGGNLGGKMGPDVDPGAITVRMDSAVYDAWEALDDDMDEYMDDSASRSVYSRVAENAAKLALAHAISVDHVSPRIGPESFEWGREIALWAANVMMREVARHVADNEQEAAYKKVANVIRDAGEEGISRRQLLRSVKTLKKRELEELVSTMCESGEVEIENKKNKRGPSSTRYVWAFV